MAGPGKQYVLFLRGLHLRADCYLHLSSPSEWVRGKWRSKRRWVSRVAKTSLQGLFMSPSPESRVVRTRSCTSNMYSSSSTSRYSS